MKTVFHDCGVSHRKWHTVASCEWPRAAWVHGNGKYASLARCRVLTVQLYATAEEALAAKQLIDRDACGGLCHNHHEVVRVTCLVPDNHERSEP